MLSFEHLMQRNHQLLALAGEVQKKSQSIREACAAILIEAQHVKRRAGAMTAVAADQRNGWIKGKPDHR